MSIERKTIETTLSIKSWKKLVFHFKFGLEKCIVRKKSLVKQIKLKSHSLAQKPAFSTVTKLSAD